MGQAKKKQRPCPAVGREIGSAECGANRASKYACPADCAYSPWAPACYDQALEIENRLGCKIVGRLVSEGIPDYSGPGLHQQQYFLNEIWLKRDASGRNLVDRWAADGFKGLGNDERFLLSCQAGMHPCLIEIQQVLSDEECLALDLLDPQAPPRILHDRSLALVALRFSRFLGLSYKTPQYWRMFGIVNELPSVRHLPPAEVVLKTVLHLGGPKAPEAVRGWLFENFARMGEAFEAIALALREQMMRSACAEFTRTAYSLTCSSADFIAAMDRDERVLADVPSGEERAEGYTNLWAWLDRRKPSMAGVGEPTLGRVLLKEGLAQIEAGSGERNRALRAEFEALFAGKVTFVMERKDDLGAQIMARNNLHYNKRLVPPSLIKQASGVNVEVSLVRVDPQARSREEFEENLLKRQKEAYLDRSIPALDNHTPREAAKIPELRRALIELMKCFIHAHDQEDRLKGRQTDINWMLKELGLPEIEMQPPPLRPRDGDSETEDDLWEAGDWEELSEFLPPHRWTTEPMSQDEVWQRIENIEDLLPEVDDLLDLFEDYSPALCNFARSCMDAEWAEDVRTFFMSMHALLWFIFFPPTHKAPALSLKRLGGKLEPEIKRIMKVLAERDQRKAIEDVRSFCQPSLYLAMAGFLHDKECLWVKVRDFEGEVYVLLLAHFKALIDELDRMAHEA